MKNTKLLVALAIAATLAACGNKESSTPVSSSAAPVVAPAVAPVVVAENVVGKKVYGSVCSLCHAANVAGAPKPGDKADWGPRIAKGKELLYTHALGGFTGAKGMMPPKGGSTTLTDDEVKAGVDYMVSLSL